MHTVLLGRHGRALFVVVFGAIFTAGLSCTGDDPSFGPIGTEDDASGTDDASLSADGGGNDAANVVDAQVDATDGADVVIVIEPVAVDTHFLTTCAVIADGRVRCWGANDTLQAGHPDAGASVRRPHEVGGVSDAVQVSTGYQHACALTKAGTVFCWGANDKGQLARPVSDTDLMTATAFAVQGLPSGDPVKHVSAGSDFTCVLTKGAKIFCWGSSFQGSIYAPDADPSQPIPPTELKVPGQSGLLFTDVRAQLTHACAIATPGSLVCWGNNSFGELGRETSGDGAPKLGPFVALPARVIAGDIHTCLVDAPNGVRCCGGNFFGQLGAAVAIGEQTSSPLSVPGMTTAIEVGAGVQNTCARFPDNTVKCVGNNAQSQLGDPSLDGGMHTTVVNVVGVADALAISVGNEHVCALRAGGGPDAGLKSVACWGGNTYGQLGIDSDAATATPSVVADLY